MRRDGVASSKNERGHQGRLGICQAPMEGIVKQDKKRKHFLVLADPEGKKGKEGITAVLENLHGRANKEKTRFIQKKEKKKKKRSMVHRAAGPRSVTKGSAIMALKSFKNVHASPAAWRERGERGENRLSTCLMIGGGRLGRLRKKSITVLSG